MPEPTVPSVGDTIGRYALERELGEGGMGKVFLARHAVTGRRVALKWMASEDKVLRTRMLREARSMGRLSHPNVVGVLDAGELDGAVFTVMDYVDGQNLRDYAFQKVLSPAEALDIMLPVLSGVAAAHQAGILHRDLKPENLFVCLDHDGTPFDTKVLDFGVAKNIDSAETTLTASGTIIGTPKYMAPEQILNGDDIDVRMDVYALGVILYELLCGKLPYKSTGLKTLVVEILAGRLPHLREQRSDLPPALCNAVMHALENERDHRYADVSELARAIEPFAGRRRFEPPRHVHTPDNTLDDESSPVAREVVRSAAGVAPTVRAPTPISVPAPQTVTRPRARAASGKTPAASPTAPKAQTTGYNVERELTDAIHVPRSRGPLFVIAGVAFLVLVALSVFLRDAPKPEAHLVKPAAAPPESPTGPVAAAAQEATNPAPAAEAKPNASPALPAAPASTPAANHVPFAIEPAPAVAATTTVAREAETSRQRVHRRASTVPPPPPATAPATSAPAAADKTVKVRGGTLTAKDF